jgi:ElaB/YqjD/DUF883 family membrane-anchored ribosome-binding protein
MTRGRLRASCRHVAHLGHEARLFQTLAADAIEDSAYAARRTIKRLKRRAQDLLDTRDEMALRVKREPLKALGLAFGAGLLVGALANWAARRCGERERG